MTGEIRTDVLIVGAGPGGSSASMVLSRHGIDHVLADRATFPRDKVCGDALSGKVMRTLERLDSGLARRLREDARQLPSWGVIFTAPGGTSLRVPFSRSIGQGDAPGAIMPRVSFDELLFNAAVSRAARPLQNSRLDRFERTAQGWQVLAGAETRIHARIVIAADGANSKFARHVAGLPMEPRHHCAGVRAYYSGVSGLDPQGFIELIFLRDLLPGYLWIFPMANGLANVGLGLRSDQVGKRRADLRSMLQDLVGHHPALRARMAAARMEGAIQGLGLPLGSKRRPISGDGYLLVGDAAHLIDPFTGEGISHAMISGMHAADVAAAALHNGATSATALRAYDARVWERLGKELSISSRLQQLAAIPWLFDRVVNKAVKNPALADMISSMFTDLDLRDRLRDPRFHVSLLFGRIGGNR